MAVVRDAFSSASKFGCEGEHTMSELVAKSVAQEQQEQKIEARTSVKRIAGLTVSAIAIAVLAVLGVVALYAQGQNSDKYSLKSPSGIAFSDFRGYEDWADVSSARTDEILKVAGMRDAVLQRGVRADEAAPGSGLGLSIVRDLVEVYGGTICLENSLLGGLRARLQFPAA
jgi:light-regulated signal transduction histidine kinase (bacteriophytochrome)